MPVHTVSTAMYTDWCKTKCTILLHHLQITQQRERRINSTSNIHCH